MNREKTVCFTGHRHLPKGEAFEKLKCKLISEINQAIADGYDTFLFGSAEGFDLLCGEIVAQMKKIIPIQNPRKIKLIAAIPYEEQAKDFSEEDRERYYKLHAQCDDVVFVSIQYHKDCFKNRNQYMIDHSSKVIAYYNGGVRSGTGQTIRMAEKQKLNIVNLY
ncbi:SLOG family protein [Chakrabartyella piscis]|uniref:SLOG family protein n=1 Tax=Chakrabartyella piscis TaxID=2918914 RepID=UPI002958A623|nr:SLOG family protein [Chakrabartyella piscis]